jgi:pyridoxamine 5'-phosphate oxidase-like protein
MAEIRRMETLTREESLRLLSSVPIGRVVFTHLALPAIRPVFHLVEDDRIVIRAYLGAAIAARNGPQGGTVVAYEADVIEPDARLGWSVIVIGRAQCLSDSEAGSRYRQILPPWAAASPDDIIAIQADLVDGFRLTPGVG